MPDIHVLIGISSGVVFLTMLGIAIHGLIDAVREIRGRTAMTTKPVPNYAVFGLLIFVAAIVIAIAGVITLCFKLAELIYHAVTKRKTKKSTALCTRCDKDHWPTCSMMHRDHPI